MYVRGHIQVDRGCGGQPDGPKPTFVNQTMFSQPAHDRRGAMEVGTGRLNAVSRSPGTLN